MTGDNRTDWQNVQVSAQFSPSIDGLASEKCKHSIHKKHSPTLVAWELASQHIDLHALTGGKTVTIHGQTEATRDLMAARREAGAQAI